MFFKDVPTLIFLRLLPLRVDELVILEMEKKWGVTDIV